MKKVNESAVILPYRDGKVLMQLRDDKSGIVFPGQWGFFSGAIEPGEEPVECARRELYEETCFKAGKLYGLSVDRIDVPEGLILHSFYCHLSINPSEITLREGYDFGLFPIDEICRKKLFSNRAGRVFSVIEHPIMNYLLESLCDAVKEAL